MRRTLTLVLAVTALSLLPAVSSAKAVAARAIIFLPLPQRVALADAIVVGKVTSIEDKTISAEAFPGAPQKTEYQIGVIKIEDGILGTKGQTHVKVGTVKLPQGGRIIRPGGGLPPRLNLDQEGVFFLQKHPTETFYTLQGPMSFAAKTNNDNYEKQLEQVKHCAKLIADPKAGLKSKDADDRALTAGMLLIRYSTPIPGQTKQEKEPIGAEESKQILTALADADWTKANTPNDLSPQWGFNRLQLTEKDGWKFQFTAGQPPTAFQDTAKAWLKENAGTYRVQKYVPEKKDEKKEEKKDK